MAARGSREAPAHGLTACADLGFHFALSSAPSPRAERCLPAASFAAQLARIAKAAGTWQEGIECFYLQADFFSLNYLNVKWKNDGA